MSVRTVLRRRAKAAFDQLGTLLFLRSRFRRGQRAVRADGRAANAGRFTPIECATVEAIARIVVPSDELTPGAHEMDVLGAPAATRVELAMGRSRDRQHRYLHGLIAFDDLARRRWGRAFAECDEAWQLELVSQVGAASERRRRNVSRSGRVAKTRHRLREMWSGWAAAVDLWPDLVEDVLDAFYSNEVSWAWLGYDGPPMPAGYPDPLVSRSSVGGTERRTVRGVQWSAPSTTPAPAAARQQRVDVVVIGSGAGGAVVAKELTEGGLRVVQLEAGRRYDPYDDYPTDCTDFELASRHVFAPDDARRDLYSVAHGGDFLYDRAKGVGGSTLKYVAMSPRLHDSDFRTQTHDGVGTDWPITYDDLEPYYTRVEYELGVSGPDGAARNPFEPRRSRPYPTPALPFNRASRVIATAADRLGLHMVREPLAIPSRDWHGRPACIGAGTCSLGCSIAAKSSMDVTYVPRAEATGRLDLRTECTAFRIETGTDGRAERVLYFDRHGQQQAVQARIVVVAGNAVETPRLLLLSESARFPHGLANSSGMVGRHFMEHLAVFATGVLPERVDAWRGPAAGGMMQDDYATSATRSFARGWTSIVIHNPSWPSATAQRIPGWGAAHKQRMARTFGYTVNLASIGEQLPSSTNFVSLDRSRVDCFGLPVPLLHNVPCDNDANMIAAIGARLRDILAAAGCTTVGDAHFQAGSSAHYMGTCRMGHDAATSVVDAFGRAHDVPNLFIADGSVMVTGGAVNPALTISALATRTAHEILRAHSAREL